MQVWMEQHGGALVTATIIIVIIAACLVLGTDGNLDKVFKAVIDNFNTKGQKAAGLTTSMINLPKLTIGLCA